MHTFIRALSVEEALDALDGGNATVLAGGTILVPEIRSHPMVVDVSRIQALRETRVTDGVLHLGACCSVLDVEGLVDVARVFATPAVREQATIGGNIASRLPTADLAVALLAMDARVRVRRKGEAVVEQSLDAYLTASFDPRALLTEILVPADAKVRFDKLGWRHGMAVTVVAVAVGSSIAVGGMGTRPLRVRSKETLDEDTAPIDDVCASALYRRQACGAMLRRLLG